MTESSDIHSPAFNGYTRAFADRFQNILGFSSTESAHLAKAMVIRSVKTQAQVTAVNDSFFIMGWVLVVVTIVVACIIIPGLMHVRKQPA